MCLMLAARMIHSETLLSNAVVEKVRETYKDPRVVGMPQLEGMNALSTRGVSMGQVVQEAEPVFSELLRVILYAIIFLYFLFFLSSISGDVLQIILVKLIIAL